MSTYSSTRRRTTVGIKNPKKAKISRSHGGSRSTFKKIHIDSYKDNTVFGMKSTFITYFTRTQDWCTTILFLTMTRPHKPASTDSIARWIRMTLIQSSPDLMAKNTRIIAAFLAQNNGVNLGSILGLGNWSNNTVYQNFIKG
ncbi:4348_t:CDS:1, partial [Acaulospora morrowiae]